MAGIRPISARTRSFMLETGRKSGWSTVDVLAVLGDLGIALPAELAADARFPGWAAFAAWSSGAR